MIYDMKDPDTWSGSVLLDGEFVPACQYADTERGIVRFAAVDENYKFYFDHKAEDFVILERTGKVEIIPGLNETEFKKYRDAKKFVQPFPYEINPDMRALA